MSEVVTRHRFVAALLALLWAIGTLRALVLCMHAPLYAYANSYDETRYTTCFHFYPDRAADVPPQLHSPEAPFARFRFIETRDPMCYWSSELAFTGATALIWKGAEALQGNTAHDVRSVAALRWLALLALSIALSRAWLRRGDGRAAIANAALVPLVFADPGNTLYLSTFYAEWTALLAAYALIALVLLWRDAPRSRRRFAVLALVAFVLATSKLQHMLLPLGLAIVVFALDRWRLRHVSWRAVALAIGALAGVYFQFVQTTREGPMMDAIRQYNSADVVFTGLLPFADDPRALLAEIGIDPGCAIYNGKHAWELPDLPEHACRWPRRFHARARARRAASPSFDRRQARGARHSGARSVARRQRRPCRGRGVPEAAALDPDDRPHPARLSGRAARAAGTAAAEPAGSARAAGPARWRLGARCDRCSWWPRWPARWP